MKKIIILLSLLIAEACYASKPIEFVIIIPTRNNQKWALENITSAAEQDYENFSIRVINDDSGDNTGVIITDYIREHKLENKIEYRLNTQRQGALKNFYDAIHEIPDHKIILMLDGDDKLAHTNVLRYLADIYNDKTTWITYGQFMHVPPGKIGSCCEFPEQIKKNNSFRSYEWVASHLRTCYAGLFKKIKKEDLLFNGEFCSVAWDNALMFPMLEMASQGHIRFIPEVLYIYNELNPASDCRIQRSLVQTIERYIRNKKQYEPLEKLDCINYYR